MKRPKCTDTLISMSETSMRGVDRALELKIVKNDELHTK